MCHLCSYDFCTLRVFVGLQATQYLQRAEGVSPSVLRTQSLLHGTLGNLIWIMWENQQFINPFGNGLYHLFTVIWGDDL
jgi:hypothetical protein